jgi:WD40 repeat protein
LNAPVNELSIGQNGTQCAALIARKKVVLLHLTSGATRREVVAPDGEFRSISLHPAEDYLVTGFDSLRIACWGIKESPVIVGDYEGLGTGDGAVQVAFSSDGKFILGATNQKAVLWKLLNSKPFQIIRNESPSPQAVYASAAVDSTASRMATAFFDQPVTLWNLDTKKPEFEWKDHSNVVVSLSINPDGTRLVTGSYDRTAIVYDLTSGKQLRRLSEHKDSLTKVLFSPNGKNILTCSHDETAILWDAETGVIVRRFSGFRSSVLCAAFSPGGRMVFLGLYDGRVILDKTE